MHFFYFFFHEIVTKQKCYVMLCSISICSARPRSVSLYAKACDVMMSQLPGAQGPEASYSAVLLCTDKGSKCKCGRSMRDRAAHRKDHIHKWQLEKERGRYKENKRATQAGTKVKKGDLTTNTSLTQTSLFQLALYTLQKFILLICIFVLCKTA